jgi:16S rRNA (cytosine1402-N4)-methyltransferase
VLLVETVALLKPGKDRVIVDGTLGGGGHSEALLEAGATVVGIDRDPSALAAATARLERFGARFRPVRGELRDVAAIAGGPVDGLLADLGVSSPQLDEAQRGFSFAREGPLDMRMAQAGETAAELIRRVDEGELADLIYEYGEEPHSRGIARQLKARAPSTTLEAAEAVKAGVPRKAWPKDVHVATRTFQALRIAVNGELDQLRAALDAVPEMLKPGGVAAVISFHSLEDRMVKQHFASLCGSAEKGDAQLLAIRQHAGEKAAAPAFKALTRKPVVATDGEVARNPRARSARLRAVEKLP